MSTHNAITTTAPAASTSTARDAHHVPLSRAQRLAQDAAEAAEVRAFSEHPDVVALRVERVRTQIDVLMWLGIALGLAFTMVNVQQFAAAGAVSWSLPWLAAWLLDPMVSIVLVAVLRAEQVTARWQVDTGPWIRRTKWFAFAATYVMNTWQSWAKLDVAGIVLHSVPPALVFLASEAAPVLRDRLTESVTRAATPRAHGSTNTAANATAEGAANTTADGAVNTTATDATGADVNAAAGVHDTTAPTSTTATAGTSTAAPRTRSASTRRKPRTAARRRSRADYLAVARARWTPGVEVTPAWIRQVTGCSRGLSSALATELRTELTTTDTAPTSADKAPTAAAVAAGEGVDATQERTAA
ncbi:hypothetical protein [Haloechinothrix salitolerans]|uniref:DUF2637 domain-containing protein n=1 Tax=Haloechinothrix salitolerans TaxID=926830 RepID=A0ABW2C0K6_9PSEU